MHVRIISVNKAAIVPPKVQPFAKPPTIALQASPGRATPAILKIPKINFSSEFIQQLRTQNNLKEYQKENNITEEIWDDVISNNLKPAFFLSKYYWKYFYEDKSSDCQGCMIHIASTAGINPAPSSPHYVAAKAGVIALAKYFAKAMTPYVRVNVIAPCYIETSKHKGAKYDKVRNSNPLKRFVTTEEVAQTAAYITECTYLNAQTIVLDGGMVS